MASGKKDKDREGGGRSGAWDPDGVRRLRQYLSRTQAELAEELGVRQQTVSEWETGLYRPRGASATVLNIIAERAGFLYRAGAEDTQGAPPDHKGADGASHGEPDGAAPSHDGAKPQ